MTSETVFANRKLSFKKILMAIWEDVTAVKGLAALHLCRKLRVQYKTAYVLLQKLREAVGARREAMMLQGRVEIEGKYVGGRLRKANEKKNRKDGRQRQNQNGKKMCVLRRVVEDDSLLCHPAVIGELALGSLWDRGSVIAFLAVQREARVATHNEVMTMIDHPSGTSTPG